ncbi:MAG: hypothetical protein M3380_04710 [Chloroflexota bacterium]|nr:hypothetical protein [Chloroflexota bacterium]
MQLPYVDLFVLLILPALALIFTFLHHARVGRGSVPTLRPLAGMAAFEKRLREVVEVGQPVHVATGASQPGAVGATAETLASLLITQRLAEAATQRGAHTAVTTGDVVALAAARGTVRQAYRGTGLAADYRGSAVQLVAHQTPIAYAAGVARRYAVEPMDMSVVVGDYGSEALLIGEEGAQRRLPQISGATTSTALPGLALSTDATLIGEELWAAEAYLSAAAAPKARLLTQDALRRILVLSIIAGMIYQVLDLFLGLGLPSL